MFDKQSVRWAGRTAVKLVEWVDREADRQDISQAGR